MGIYTIPSDDGVCRLAIDGPMTIQSIARLKAGFACLPAAPADVEVDLSGVTEVDSAGLQLMLMAKRLAGRTVRFVRHSPVLVQTLEWTRLAAAVGDPLVIAGGDAVV